MTHRRGRRSDVEAQRREAARIVRQHAIRDLQIKESINILNCGEVAVKLERRFGTFDVDVINSYDRGEVLSDMYRRGTLQRLGALM